MNGKLIILLSVASILYISMQNTINTIAFGEDIIEVFETNESEEKEREIEKEIEFIHGYLNCQLLSQCIDFESKKASYKILKYNSPIKSVLTPPPNTFII